MLAVWRGYQWPSNVESVGWLGSTVSSLVPLPESWLALAREASVGNRALGDLTRAATSDAATSDVALDLARLLAMRRPRAVRGVLDELPPSDRASTVTRLLDAAVEARIGSVGAVAGVLEELIHRARIDADERTLAWAAGWERERRLAVERSHERLERALAEQELLREELEVASRTDALTGLANRRLFDQRLSFVRSQATRYRRPTSLLLLDVDHFKKVNDSHGHDVGDEVLVGVSQRARGCVRDTDVLARWGGEEFVALLPETDGEGARVCASKLIEAVRAEPFATRVGPVVVTVSIGVATAPAGDEVDLLRRADQALYRAKTSGRDRVVRWPQSSR